jgi:site-specific recombinase XerD
VSKPNSKPFWRESKGAYYCWIDGHQKSLGKTKNHAWTKYRELVADREKLTARKAWTVGDCFAHYLEFAATLDPNSFRNRKQTLDAFCEEAKVGKLPFTDLTVDHLEAWAATKDWSSSTKRSKINHVMAAFNYCVKRKKISGNPIHGIAKPRWERRKEVIDMDDERQVYEASKGPFRAILTVLRQTSR